MEGMFVLGTAGHIDHGKSTLVKALTSIDPDRLQEEKERSMTIDLGFAWLKLPGGREVGIVDVPGHERFVKNMLAGVGGIDLALLIIDASEGVMPQTREHLAIIDLLEIKKGIVALTKKDLVDAEWLDMVKMEVEEELLKPTSLAGSPVIAVSSVTGEGLPELKATIERMLSAAEPRRDLGRPRLAIDRIFTMSGSGTVVTGTLIDGKLNAGDEVEIQPSGLKARIRGLQTHKARIDTALPGSRVAANLAGVTVSQLQRGDVVTRPGWLKPTSLVSVKLRLLPYLRHPLKNNTTLSFYTGSTETPAKLRLLEGDELQPGAEAWAQLVLEKPAAAVNGDHFIIRSTTETLGGGKIVEAQAQRLRRLRPEVTEGLKARAEGTAEESILALLEARQPVAQAALAAQSKLPPAEAQNLIDELINLKRVVRLGEGAAALLITAAAWERLAKQALSAAQEYHKKFPLRAGIPRIELGHKLKLGAAAPLFLERMTADGLLAEAGLSLKLPAHKVQLTPQQEKQARAFLESLAGSPYSPPADLLPDAEVLSVLAEQGKVVKVSENVAFTAQAYREMVDKVKAQIKARGKITLGEVRDLFQTSRKYAQALLEHMDGEKITRRVGDERVLY